MKDFEYWLAMGKPYFENSFNSEGKGFIRDLEINPDDVNLWKIYSDFLEDSGRGSCADLIRFLFSSGSRNLGKLKKLEEYFNDLDVRIIESLRRVVPLVGRAFNWNIKLSECGKILTLLSSVRNRKDIDRVLDETNKIIKGHGIEAIRGEIYDNHYWGDTVGLYINMGDTYKLTVIYDVLANRFFIMDLGSWMEKRQRRYGID